MGFFSVRQGDITKNGSVVKHREIGRYSTMNEARDAALVAAGDVARNKTRVFTAYGQVYDDGGERTLGQSHYSRTTDEVVTQLYKRPYEVNEFHDYSGWYIFNGEAMEREFL